MSVLITDDLRTRVLELDEVAKKVHKIEDIDITTQNKAVFYTDGGYRSASHILVAPPSVGGYGLFGYMYYDAEPRKGHGTQGFTPTPAGLLNHDQLGRPFGEARIKPTKVTVRSYFQAMGAAFDCKSNNTAEVSAILAALRIISDLNITYAVIKTDSKYALYGLTEYCAKWSKNGWRKADGEPVANVVQWKEVYKFYTDLLDSGCTIVCEWVKGHKDSKGNVEADRLAGMSMNSCVNSNESIEFATVIDPAEAWNPKVVSHPLVTEAKLYYDNLDTGNEIAGLHFYYTADPKKLEDDMFGKPSSDAMMACIALKEPEPVLQCIYDTCAHFKHYNNMLVFVGRIDLAFRPVNYQLIKQYGIGALRKDIHSMAISLPCKTPLIRQMSNQNHGEAGMNEMRKLRDMLLSYLDRSIYTTPGVVVNDVTAVVYHPPVEVKKKMVIEPVMANTDKSITVPVIWEHPVNGKVLDQLVLTEAVNTPRFRHFKHFTNLPDLKVMVVTVTNSTAGYSHYTIISSAEGYGIWAGVYSNGVTILD